jgi:hypoxanthine phosphoribosyltransferase
LIISTAKENLSYEEFGLAIRELAQSIADSGFRPDAILSIARGGFMIGGALGYALGVKNTLAMSVEFYTGEDKRLPVPVVLPPIPKVSDFQGLTILIADDVADTGETLKLVQEFVAPHVKEARSAVLYEKPHSVIKPDYVWQGTDKWINFPWSTLPSVSLNS